MLRLRLKKPVSGLTESFVLLLLSYAVMILLVCWGKEKNEKAHFGKPT